MNAPARPIRFYRYPLSGHAHRVELLLSLLRPAVRAHRRRPDEGRPEAARLPRQERLRPGAGDRGRRHDDRRQQRDPRLSRAALRRGRPLAAARSARRGASPALAVGRRRPARLRPGRGAAGDAVRSQARPRALQGDRSTALRPARSAAVDARRSWSATARRSPTSRSTPTQPMHPKAASRSSLIPASAPGWRGSRRCRASCRCRARRCGRPRDRRPTPASPFHAGERDVQAARRRARAPRAGRPQDHPRLHARPASRAVREAAAAGRRQPRCAGAALGVGAGGPARLRPARPTRAR